MALLDACEASSRKKVRKVVALQRRPCALPCDGGSRFFGATLQNALSLGLPSEVLRRRTFRITLMRFFSKHTSRSYSSALSFTFTTIGTRHALFFWMTHF